MEPAFVLLNVGVPSSRGWYNPLGVHVLYAPEGAVMPPSECVVNDRVKILALVQ